MGPVGAALLGGGISTASNLITGVASGLFSKSESEKSYDRQMEMLKYQNEYNSPIKQMERYTEAGLNPNLIYGSGSASSGQMQSIPKYEPATMQMNSNLFGDPIGTYQRLTNLDNTLESGVASRSLMYANVSKAIEQSLTEAEKRLNLQAGTAKTYAEKDNLKTLGEYIDRVQEANINNTLENTKLLSEKIEQTKQMVRESQESVRVKQATRKNLGEDYVIKKQEQDKRSYQNKQRNKYGLDDGIVGQVGKFITTNISEPIEYYWNKYIK